MKALVHRLVPAALLGLVLIAGWSAPVVSATTPTQTAVLSGGCFWGMEAVFGSLHGVTEAMPGYAGGSASTAHYEDVETGSTGHAESVRVTFDPTKISYEQILQVYFTVAHDPTELNRQGPDDGTQYRSEIWALNDEQRQIAEATIKRLTAEHRYPQPIVTKIEAYRGFYPAEAYHRHYVALHPDDPYVVYNDLPKLAALKQQYPQLVAAR